MEVAIIHQHVEEINVPRKTNFRIHDSHIYGVWQSMARLNTPVLMLAQQTRDVELMLVYCWPTIYDAGPTLNQLWFCVMCLL